MSQMLNKDNIWLEKAKNLYNIKKQIDELSKMEKSLSLELRDLSGNDMYQVDNIKYRWEERKGSVDYSLIPELRHIDLDPYRKEPIRIWKLEITHLKEGL